MAIESRRMEVGWPSVINNKTPTGWLNTIQKTSRLVFVVKYLQNSFRLRGIIEFNHLFFFHYPKCYSRVIKIELIQIGEKSENFIQDAIIFLQILVTFLLLRGLI